ncbi:zinc finger protein 182-like isoform X2 [Plodia interpunctella]|uniref:zinc finger protein 182-like isoform X2 n=1 Tax=Plodia interpunctella TaxID=58824 RepID=UPI002367B5CD|nr:zinc finger protein 182-like isoform X2 [Plodia interpunctella]
MMDIVNEGENVGFTEANKIECRACLQIFDVDVEKCLFNLFQAWTPPWDGMGSTVADDLSKIANIKIMETDKHSKLICETCYQKLREACIFTTYVYNNDIVLRQRYSELTSNLDKEWPKPIQITNINGTVFESSMNVEVKQEVLSDEEYGNINGMEEDYLDLEIKIEPEEIMAQKPIQITAVNGTIIHNSTENVDKITNGTNQLHEHKLDFDVEIKEEPLSEEEETDPSGDLSLECMLCTKSFNSVAGLKSHVITQHSYKSVKRKTDNNPSPLNMDHLHMCTVCRQRFATSAELLEHGRSHSRPAPRKLDDVKRVKLQPKEEEEILRCKECNQEFSDPFYLSVHMEVHQPSEPEPVEDQPKTKESDIQPLPMETQSLEDIFTDTT